jgi:hypothetical protein
MKSIHPSGVSHKLAVGNYNLKLVTNSILEL